VTEDQFGKHEMRQDAVIRRIEVIGEAADRLMKAVPEHETSFPGLPLADAKRMRNFVIHGYDGVDFCRVWDTGVNDIPSLRDKAAHLLDKRRAARAMAGTDLPQP